MGPIKVSFLVRLELALGHPLADNQMDPFGYQTHNANSIKEEECNLAADQK